MLDGAKPKHLIKVRHLLQFQYPSFRCLNKASVYKEKYLFEEYSTIVIILPQFVL